MNNKTEATVNTIMDTLKAQIGTDGMVDVGSGAEAVFNTTRKRMNIALALLVSEGYVNVPIWVPMVGEPGKKNVINVLAYKGATGENVFKNRSEIQPIKWNGEPKATSETIAKRLAKLMKQFGRNNTEIAEKLGISESKVTVLLNEETA